MPSHICHQQGGVPSVNKVPSGANFTRAHLLRARVGSSAARGPGQGARRISPHRTHGGLGHGAIARACTSAGLALALGSRPAGSGASASMRPMNTCAPRAHACGPADGTQLLLSARPASAAVAHTARAPQAQAATHRLRAHTQHSFPGSEGETLRGDRAAPVQSSQPARGPRAHRPVGAESLADGLAVGHVAGARDLGGDERLLGRHLGAQHQGVRPADRRAACAPPWALVWTRPHA